MGRLDPERGNAKYNVEFEFTAASPNLRLSVYLMDWYRSRTLHSQRFDFKARGREEALESRWDWASTDKTKFLGDVFALAPLAIRGGDFEVALTCSRNPCFSIIRWKYKEFHMAVDVRPSPPYSDWAYGHSRPSTWIEAVTHEDDKFDKVRARGSPNASSSSDSPDGSGPSHFDRTLPLQPQTHDFYCQFTASRRSVSCQSSVSTREFWCRPRFDPPRNDFGAVSSVLVLSPSPAGAKIGCFG